MKTDDYDWDRVQGHVGSYGTGPDFDHTTGTGHYMLLETSGRYVHDRAALVSNIYQASSDQCTLNFWYHMRGISLGSLDVVINDT